MHVKVAGLDDLQRLSVFFLEAGSEAGQGALGFTGATDDVIHELASERTLEAKLRVQPFESSLQPRTEASLASLA